jgi:hypothetical protein
MERRYLIATLALVATFGVVSNGLRSGWLSRIPTSRAEFVADAACVRQYVATKLMAKLEPYVDHQRAEEAQMVAELNLPELVRAQQQAADAEGMLAQQIARQKCEAAARANRIPQQVYQMRTFVTAPAIKVNDPAIVRAQELSERAQEWQASMKEHNLELQLKSIERAQQISERAMEHAQRTLERQQRKLAVPAAPAKGIHVNFSGTSPMIVFPAAPATPDFPSATIE